MKKGLVVYNFRSDPVGVVIPSADKIPTLVPSDKLNQLQNSDNDPYYKIQAIEYPAKGTGGIYEESFFESFLNKLNERPIPGSKRGHEFTSRPASDFYLVGGMVEKKGNGTGIVYLKNYIPKDGDTTSNSGFIRDNKAGIVNFSLVTMPRYNVEVTPEGYEERHFIESLGYERNDAVEYGAGAMNQVTNADGQGMMAKSVSNAKKLIAAGKINADGPWAFSAADGDKLLGENGDDWTNYALWHMVEDTNVSEDTKNRFKYPYGKGGLVYRSALRAIAARAAQQDLQDVSDMASGLIELIDKSKKEGNKVTKEEVLEYLKVNNGIPLEEIARAMGQESKLDNGRVLALTEENSKLKADVEAVEAEKIINSLDKEFGPAGEKNLLRAYAGKQQWNSAKFADQLAEFKKDPIALSFAGQQVNANSAVNVIEENKNKNQEAAKYVCGVPVVEV